MNDTDDKHDGLTRRSFLGTGAVTVGFASEDYEFSVEM